MTIQKKMFSDEEYKKLEMLSVREKGTEKRVIKKFVNGLKKE